MKYFISPALKALHSFKNLRAAVTSGFLRGVKHFGCPLSMLNLISNPSSLPKSLDTSQVRFTSIGYGVVSFGRGVLSVVVTSSQEPECSWRVTLDVRSGCGLDVQVCLFRYHDKQPRSKMKKISNRSLPP